MFQLWQKRPLFYRLLNPKKNDNEQSNMVSKSDFKNLFESSLKEMLTKKDKQAKKKKNAEDDD
jgi:hypothetical protein